MARTLVVPASRERMYGIGYGSIKGRMRKGLISSIIDR
jgi:hypothetical protein